MRPTPIRAALAGALALLIAACSDTGTELLTPNAPRHDVIPGSNLVITEVMPDPSKVADHVSGLRVFAGYAGWSPCQLAGEIAEGAWACVPSRPGDVLSELSGPQLWRRVVGRQAGRLAVLSTAPADPAGN